MKNSDRVLQAIQNGLVMFREIQAACQLTEMEARNAIGNLKARQKIKAVRTGLFTKYYPRGVQ